EFDFAGGMRQVNQAVIMRVRDTDHNIILERQWVDRSVWMQRIPDRQARTLLPIVEDRSCAFRCNSHYRRNGVLCWLGIKRLRSLNSQSLSWRLFAPRERTTRHRYCCFYQ